MSPTRWREEERQEEDREPEITLSTASLLALFLGLVLVCGVFFGLGYSVGRRAPINLALHADSSDGGGGDGPAAPAADPAPQSIFPAAPAVEGNAAAEESAAAKGFESNSSSPGSSPHSSSGSPGLSDAELSSTGSGSLSSAALSGAPSPAGDVTPLPVLHETLPPAPSDAGSSSPSSSPDAAAERPVPPAALRRATTPPPSKIQPALPVSSPGKTSAIQPMVQVAAVVHREDADVLVSALRKRGYNAVVRTELQDKFLHVQVGPFASRVEANAMRKKLFSDGYNAIIKQ